MKDVLIRADGLRRGPGAGSSRPGIVLVLNGRVAFVGDREPAALPEGLPTLSGGCVTELLADAHVHLFLPGSFDPEERRRVADLGRERALERVLGLLEAYLCAGICAVRDGGEPHGLALEAARLARAEPTRYARVFPSGEPVRRRGEYGGFLGPGIEDARGACRLLERNAGAGATQAKILATGMNSLDRAGEVGPAQFSAAELAEIVARARDLGLPAMVHANGPLGAVLRARPASVEHGFWLEPGDVDHFAPSGNPAWVPTLEAWAALSRHPGLNTSQLGVVEETLRRHRGEVGWAAEQGITVAAGSDAGTPGVDHVSGLFGELERLSETALGRVGALGAAAHAARDLCGGGLPGLVEGGAAGFLWLDGDPAEDLGFLRAPRGVYLAGRWVAGPNDGPAGGAAPWFRVTRAEGTGALPPGSALPALRAAERSAARLGSNASHGLSSGAAGWARYFQVIFGVLRSGTR